MSHLEIAKLLNISRTRVWQIEQRALAKLRRDPLLAKMFREHLEDKTRSSRR